MKKYRENNTRKCSRLHTMTDLIHALLISSDSVIGSKTTVPSKKLRPLSKEVIGLLKLPQAPTQEKSSFSESVDSSSEGPDQNNSDED